MVFPLDEILLLRPVRNDFGTRYQAKGQAFQASLTAMMAHTPQVVRNIEAIRALRASGPGVADVGVEEGAVLDVVAAGNNQAVAAWKGSK